LVRCPEQCSPSILVDFSKGLARLGAFLTSWIHPSFCCCCVDHPPPLSLSPQMSSACNRDLFFVLCDRSFVPVFSFQSFLQWNNSLTSAGDPHPHSLKLCAFSVLGQTHFSRHNFCGRSLVFRLRPPAPFLSGFLFHCASPPGVIPGLLGAFSFKRFFYNFVRAALVLAFLTICSLFWSDCFLTPLAAEWLSLNVLPSGLPGLHRSVFAPPPPHFCFFKMWLVFIVHSLPFFFPNFFRDPSPFSGFKVPSPSSWAGVCKPYVLVLAPFALFLQVPGWARKPVLFPNLLVPNFHICFTASPPCSGISGSLFFYLIGPRRTYPGKGLPPSLLPGVCPLFWSVF